MTAEIVHHQLRPEPGARLSLGPWSCSDEAVVHDAEGRCVCVLGGPFEGVAEQDITNGAAIVAVPELLEAAKLLRAVRPTNFDDGEDPQAAAAWSALDLALSKAGAL